MGLPHEQGLAVLFALADQWRHDRQLLAALGVEEPGTAFDSALASPASRAEQIAKLGGEVMIS